VIANVSDASQNKRIVIISGPNGAGKTTFARNFVNADLIAAALSPFAPELAPSSTEITQ
jgi:predicted ABC-type ATPase